MYQIHPPSTVLGVSSRAQGKYWHSEKNFVVGEVIKVSGSTHSDLSLFI